MFSLIMSKKRFSNFSEPWLMHMWHRPKYWGPIVTHTWLALDVQGIRHDTSQNDQFAWAVVLIRESSHRKSHFPQRYPDTFLFSPGDVNRLSIHLASVKKKKKRLSETEKASASDPEWTEGGYVVKFLLILDISGGEVVFRNKLFPLPWPSSPNRLACAAGVWKGREKRPGDEVGVLGKGVLGARETWSCALIPFPFPFERLPRRLRTDTLDRRNEKEFSGWWSNIFVTCDV